MKPDIPAIAVENLTARYGERTILEGVTCAVRPGEVFLIIGGSGCGKSTLLKYMIGLYTPAVGRVCVNGIDLSTLDEEALLGMRKGMGVLFQSGALIGSMTLFENVALPLSEHTRLPDETIARIVRMKLALVDLAGYENLYPAELSGGMKKRAGLARAMALDPKILFFDEPSSGLDPVSSAELEATITRINRGTGTTMVIVSHDLDLIFHIAHRMVLLDGETRGIIAEGDPHQLRETSRDRRVIRFLNRTIEE